MRDLLVRQSFELAQYQDLAELDREPVEPLAQGLSRHRARQVRLRPRLALLHGVLLLVELHGFRRRAPATKSREAGVAHDAQQPRATVGPAKVPEVADRPHERILDRVLGLVRVAQQVPGQVVRRVEVAKNGLVEAFEPTTGDLPLLIGLRALLARQWTAPCVWTPSRPGLFPAAGAFRARE